MKYLSLLQGDAAMFTQQTNDDASLTKRARKPPQFLQAADQHVPRQGHPAALGQLATRRGLQRFSSSGVWGSCFQPAGCPLRGRPVRPQKMGGSMGALRQRANTFWKRLAAPNAGHLEASQDDGRLCSGLVREALSRVLTLQLAKVATQKGPR